jgi:SAM-dependent methyltransferase
MERRDAAELLENPSLPDEVVAESYQSLARMHAWLGDTRAILRLLRNGPVHSVLDLGCGHGELLREIRRKLHVDVIGFDIRPAPDSSPVRILTGDAVVDPLPRADAALAVCVVHHLSEADIVRLIRNVSKTCRRLIILDPVRHWLPLWLFRIFVGPFLPRINAADGVTSIRRSYTPRELKRIAETAVQGTGARVRQRVAPLYIRQILDISW